MLKDLFSEPDKIVAVFLKVLTHNESGEVLSKHGVVIPVGAYRFFPEFPDYKIHSERNYSLPLMGESISGNSQIKEPLAYKHYQRYPERRIPCWLRSRSA